MALSALVAGGAIANAQTILRGNVSKSLKIIL